VRRKKEEVIKKKGRKSTADEEGKTIKKREKMI
jgi:hypothetical protein